jgi:hypothetical protein
VSDYPPKLLAVSEASFGSILSLADGIEVPLNLTPARFAEVIAEGLSPLPELIASQTLGVFAGLFTTGPEQWASISKSIRSSGDAAAVFSRHPRLWECFGEPFDHIARMPHRLYGGISRYLYTSHPFDFQASRQRPAPWYRALLSAPGGWLFTTWVHLESGEVEATADQALGHYVE